MQPDPSLPLTIEEARSEFSQEPGYLNSASIGIPPRQAVEELHAGLDRWARGGWTAPQFDRFTARARQMYADFVHVPVSSVAIGSTVSAFVGQVVSSLPAGSEVVYVKDDFTSLLFPILERARAGELSVREVELDALPGAIRPETAMAAVSAVQSADGRIVDFEALSRAAQKNGATTLIDATQAVGWLPLDARPFDYVVTAAYKWLLCPRGVAFMSVNPERMDTLRPRNAGWYAGEDVWTSTYGAPLRLASSARRFDTSPSWLSWLGAVSAMSLLQRIGIAHIHAYNVSLAHRFTDRIGMPAPNSAILSIPKTEAARALRNAGFVVSERNGKTRISFHLYNTEEEADRAADVVNAGAGRQ